MIILHDHRSVEEENNKRVLLLIIKYAFCAFPQESYRVWITLHGAAWLPNMVCVTTGFTVISAAGRAQSRSSKAQGLSHEHPL